MDLHILSLSEAIEFDPDKKTYVIRIFSSWDRESDKPRLKPRIKYKHICEYTFDDVSPWMAPGYLKKYILFNSELAEKIIREFDQHQKGCEALVVHCSRGINRSPAVGIALNELFEFGHPTQNLKERYYESNWHVYDTLIEAGARITPKTLC